MYILLTIFQTFIARSPSQISSPTLVFRFSRNLNFNEKFGRDISQIHTSEYMQFEETSKIICQNSTFCLKHAHLKQKPQASSTFRRITNLKLSNGCIFVYQLKTTKRN